MEGPDEFIWSGGGYLEGGTQPKEFPDIELPAEVRPVKEGPPKECPDCGRMSPRARCRSCASVVGNKNKSRRPPKGILAEQVWKMSTIDVARLYGVSDVAVAKWCRFYGIKKPGRGYWARVYAGKEVKP